MLNDRFLQFPNAVGRLLQSLQLTDSVLDELLIDRSRGSVIDVDHLGIALEFDRVERVCRDIREGLGKIADIPDWFSIHLIHHDRIDALITQGAWRL